MLKKFLRKRRANSSNSNKENSATLQVKKW